MEVVMTVAIPTNCQACGKPLLLCNMLVDDGCPCNSRRGVNFMPRPCVLCRTGDCVKPAHIILDEPAGDIQRGED